ncbi:hypothetical protein JO84_gp271 [Aureococcus anophagefferens virus]|uniref:Uncharacterized protein n=1 Tax=Aureococcus anophagefferens virus TaxID=1474867 RepID=A0A076FFI0_9VIRU|nr:hypothetical protein JO84_gp271 [Aureococcus anophagefferens virus]AII17004.1 hypothetical protein AaV_204 [Aureococcus anophagefferens virus]UOG94118.1 concanavalin A-like lectin/glucanase [Aureococcus anophagefferens virus]
MKELQVWVNGTNIAKSNIGGVSSFETQTTSILNRINDENIGNAYISGSISIGDNVGIDLGIDVSSYDLESIVMYNYTDGSDNGANSLGLRLELLNSNDEIVFVTNEISEVKNYYRFNGDRKNDGITSITPSTTDIIDDSGNTEFV